MGIYVPKSLDCHQSIVNQAVTSRYWDLDELDFGVAIDQPFSQRN